MAASAVLLGNASSFCFRKPKLHSVKTKVAGASELGFLSSEFAGTRISLPSSLLFPKPLVAPSMPTTNLMPIVARRVCPFTGKKTNRANKVSFSNHKTKKLQFVNLQYKRIWWEAGNRWLKLRLSTNAIKTIEKNGLEAVAKKAGIELKKIR